MVASAVEAMAMEAWAVAMAPATALASAGWAVHVGSSSLTRNRT